MKKLTLTIVSVIIVLFAAFATYTIMKRYDASQSAKRAETATIAAQQKTAVKQAETSLQAEKTTLVTQYNQLRDQCLKGKAAYDLLTPAAKAKTDAPACGDAR